MDLTEVLTIAYDVLVRVVVASAIYPLGAFIYYYATEPVGERWFQRRYSNLWRSTPIGITVMYQKIAWLLMFTLTGAALFFGEYPGRRVAVFVVFLVVVTLFWRVLFTLRRIQKEDEKE